MKERVLFRNCFYVLIRKWDQLYVTWSNKKLINITDKKYILVPENMWLVEFSILYKWNKLTWNK
jgi:hypothetical protein